MKRIEKVQQSEHERNYSTSRQQIRCKVTHAASPSSASGTVVRRNACPLSSSRSESPEQRQRDDESDDLADQEQADERIRSSLNEDVENPANDKSAEYRQSRNHRRSANVHLVTMSRAPARSKIHLQKLQMTISRLPSTMIRRPIAGLCRRRTQAMQLLNTLLGSLVISYEVDG